MIEGRPATNTTRCCARILPPSPRAGFCDSNPQTALAMNWHIEIIAAKLAAVRRARSAG